MSEPGDPPLPEEPEGEREASAEERLVADLLEAFGEAVTPIASPPQPRRAGEPAAELALRLACGRSGEILAALKHRHRFTTLVDLCGVDDPAADPPLRVVYHLYSFRQNVRVRLEVPVGEGAAVPSATALWPGADWLEREAWDLFGLRFDGHPGLERLLLWEGFDGHPLRKDFPLEGKATGAALYPDYFEPVPEPR
jgi:NADH/F420H2 dehydrogenase subunit C